MNASVSRDYIATACPSHANVRIRLSWSVSDPDAVVMSFPRRLVRRVQPWTFSRDLLVWGLSGEAGVGDVCCESEGDDYGITLLGSGEEAGLNVTLAVERSWVEEFLTATTLPADADPYGDALDAILAQILEEAA